jgi:hypothetical protein
MTAPATVAFLPCAGALSSSCGLYVLFLQGRALVEHRMQSGGQPRSTIIRHDALLNIHLLQRRQNILLDYSFQQWLNLERGSLYLL